MANGNRLVSERRIAVGIFFVVLAAYIVTYNGAFKSNDERALFSGIDSFIKRGAFTTNQIYWDYTHVGVFTTGGDMVPNYEPAQMVVAIPLYLWGRALAAGVQGVMFFGAIVMAASAALIYLSLLELGCGRRSAALGAFVFAFATAAWPYSRSFFREPLTILAYLLAFYGLFRYRPPAPRRLIWPALTGFALGLALTTKQIGVAIVPSLVLLAVGYERRRTKDEGPRTKDEAAGRVWGERVRAMIAFAVPLAIMLLLNRWYAATTLGGVETFARDVVDYTTNPQLSSSAPVRMLRAVLGLTDQPVQGAALVLAGAHPGPDRRGAVHPAAAVGGIGAAGRGRDSPARLQPLQLLVGRRDVGLALHAPGGAVPHPAGRAGVGVVGE